MTIQTCLMPALDGFDEYRVKQDEETEDDELLLIYEDVYEDDIEEDFEERDLDMSELGCDLWCDLDIYDIHNQLGEVDSYWLEMSYYTK